MPDLPVRHHATIFDPGYTHCCIQTPNIQQFITNTHATDARPRSQPVDLGTGHRYVYLDDDDGIVTECEGVPYAPTESPAWLAHIAIASTDISRLAAFYTAVTGGTVQTSPVLADNRGIDTIAQVDDIRAQAAWVRGANLTIELWQFASPAPRLLPPRQTNSLGYGGMTLCVTNLQEAITHLTACGARTDDQITWYDPDGNQISLVTHTDPIVTALGSRTELHMVQRIASLWQR